MTSSESHQLHPEITPLDERRAPSSINPAVAAYHDAAVQVCDRPIVLGWKDNTQHIVHAASVEVTGADTGTVQVSIKGAHKGQSFNFMQNGSVVDHINIQHGGVTKVSEQVHSGIETICTGESTMGGGYKVTVTPDHPHGPHGK